MQSNPYLKIGRYLAYLVLFLLISYTFLQSIYIAIIGGTAIFFLVILTLLIQLWTCGKQNKIYQIAMLLLGVIILVYALMMHRFSLAFIPLLTTGLLILNVLNRINLKPLMIMMLFIAGLFYLLLLQYHYLADLKQHYQQFETGETWQQMGAL